MIAAGRGRWRPHNRTQSPPRAAFGVDLPCRRLGRAHGPTTYGPDGMRPRATVRNSAPSGHHDADLRGAAFAPPTPSSGCTRSSSAGSRRRLCCHRPTPQRCCSGRCLPLARSTCAKLMADKRSLPSPSISQLTSPHDQITSRRWRSRRVNPNHIPDGTISSDQDLELNSLPLPI
jgi:hypothetical protein